MNKLKFKNFFPFILAGLGAILSIALTLVLTNGLGKERYGEIQYFIGIITTFSAFSAFGIPNLLIRDAHLYENKKSFFTTCLLIAIGLNVIAFPIFFIICYFAFSGLNKNVFVIIPIIVCSITSSLLIITQYLYFSTGKKNIATFVGSIAFKLLVLVTSTILLLLHLEDALFKYFMYIYMGGYLLVLLPPLFKNLNKDLVKLNKPQFLSALFFMIIAFCSGTTTQIAKIFIGEAGEGSFGAVAVYSVSVQISTVISTFTLMISSLARPKFAEYYTNKDQDNLVKLYRSSLRLTLRLAIPIYIGIMVQQDSLFTLFGDGYVGYPLVFILLAIGYLISDICGPSSTLLAMGHEEKYETIANIVQFVIFFVIGITLVKILYYAVPLAILISYSVSTIIRVIIVKWKFKFFVFDYKTIIEIVVISALSFLIFFLINLIPNLVIKIVVDCVVGVILLACLYLLPYFRKDKDYFLLNV